MRSRIILLMILLAYLPVWLPAGDASKWEQHIVDVNFNAGIGWRF